MSQGPSLVLEWLSRLHLAQYLEAFVDNGYDDLEVCKQIGDPDLDAIGVQIQFHRHRLLTAVHRLQGGKNGKSAGYYFTLEPLDGDRKFTSGLHESSCPGKHNLKLSRCSDFVTYPKLKLKVLLRDRLSRDGINLGGAPYSREKASS